MSPPNNSHNARRLVRQYVATKQGGPFQIIQTDYPTPGPDEICIRNRAVALNPLDLKSLDHGMMVKEWPEVFGVDAAGVVEAVGDKVTDFKAGDAVMSLAGFGGQAGAFQDVTVVPSHFAAKKPSGWTFEEAASVPLIYLTASAAILKGLSIRLPFMQDPPKDLMGGPDGISHVDSHNRNHSISVTKSLLTALLNNKENEEGNDDHPSNPTSSANPSLRAGPAPPAHQRTPQIPRLTTTNLSGNSLPFSSPVTAGTGTPIAGQPTSPAPKISSVLVLGGSSGIGSSTLQLLRVALGPGVTLISTNSPANNPHCLKLGANTCVDRSYEIGKLVAAIKNATPNKSGVDAIVDAVGAVSPSAGGGDKNTSFRILESLNKTGPKLFSQVMTTTTTAAPSSSPSQSLGQPQLQQQIQIPASMGDVKIAQPVFGRMTFEVVPGGMHAMSRLTELVDAGGARFKLPLNVEVVGKGLESIGPGLEKLRRGGVSATKLVVSL